MSIYEDQKKPVSQDREQSDVEGFVAPKESCHKCGAVRDDKTELNVCEHCGWNVRLCTRCFFGKEHWEDYLKNYELHPQE